MIPFAGPTPSAEAQASERALTTTVFMSADAHMKRTRTQFVGLLALVMEPPGSNGTKLRRSIIAAVIMRV
ncbi:hypothetical protein KC340_g11715 [Hortaea werneckii]|nr:hypothetical protein KC342_g7879 [Hortaea werneckii]KAI7097065.1 hypothetical protein KC339_g9933 [Hortaea werneckii]KAI7230935.1 hypothetical protein KC365_g7418 [Hortaea werneckii]KAI7306420.1 hypothetical protein KC340_g11715 [Hortaea werneckii]